jgi:uncharacterized protein
MKFVLVLGVVVAVLWWLLRRPRVSRRQDQASPPVATFVACAHCGVHLPAGDALSDGTRHYCSEAHRLAGPRDHDAR